MNSVIYLPSAYVHVLADALTSVLAIAALLAGSYLGRVWLDPVMGIVSMHWQCFSAADIIRERLKPVHEVSHLTVEFREV